MKVNWQEVTVGAVGAEPLGETARVVGASAGFTYLPAGFTYLPVGFTYPLPRERR